MRIDSRTPTTKNSATTTMWLEHVTDTDYLSN